MKEQHNIKTEPSKEKQKEYQEYVKEIAPTNNLWLQMGKAFLVGGAICTLGQLILHYAKSLGIDEESAGAWCVLLLILLGVVLTGANLYSGIAKFGGAGALVPITGFANSVAAPGIEFKKEGHVFGIGAKIFGIAGPVILYGILSSWILGILLYLFQ